MQKSGNNNAQTFCPRRGSNLRPMQQKNGFNMKEVNEELEGNSHRWDSILGRWIEPDEVTEDLPLDKTEATTQWFDEKDKNYNDSK
jgi:hypothetical protein